MPETLTITEVPGPAYTWARANFTWASASAGKAWTSANPSAYGITVAVLLALSDSRAGAVTKPVSEPLRLADALIRQPTIRRSEVLGFAETYADLIAFVLRFVESLAMGESVMRGTHKAVSESLQCSDQLAKRTGQQLHQELGLGDAMSRSIEQRLSEALALAGPLHLGLGKYLAEGFGLGDGLEHSMVQCLSEALGFAETYTDLVAWVLAISEGLAVSSGLGQHISKPLAESFQMTGQLAKLAVKSVTEVLALVEALGRTVAYRRAINEGLGLSESLTRACRLNLREALALAEQYRRHANGVVSDMLVASTVLSEQDFIDIVQAGHPPGFTDFRDFIQGDHTYRRALFRAVLESQKADRGFIDGLRLTVDVPDVFDRGSGQITNAADGVAVTFARTFLIPPEVTITHKGGSVLAVPRLLGAVTTTGFTAVLEDSSGARVSGSFTWVAQGY